MEKLIGTIGDLQDAIAHAPREQRVDTWYKNTGRYLVARGVWGENTDFSFEVYDEPPDRLCQK
jgi:hypothetical protein